MMFANALGVSKTLILSTSTPPLKASEEMDAPLVPPRREVKYNGLSSNHAHVMTLAIEPIPAKLRLALAERLSQGGDLISMKIGWGQKMSDQSVQEILAEAARAELPAPLIAYRRVNGIAIVFYHPDFSDLVLKRAFEMGQNLAGRKTILIPHSTGGGGAVGFILPAKPAAEEWVESSFLFCARLDLLLSLHERQELSSLVPLDRARRVFSNPVL